MEISGKSEAFWEAVSPGAATDPTFGDAVRPVAVDAEAEAADEKLSFLPVLSPDSCDGRAVVATIASRASLPASLFLALLSASLPVRAETDTLE
jgi:hypothetical protein